MSGLKHTPGPWSMWTSCSFRRISSASGGDGDVLCAVVQRADGHPDLHFSNGGFEGPDAKLILAAPEMFEALQAMSAHYSGSLDHQPAFVRLGRAALAKATDA